MNNICINEIGNLTTKASTDCATTLDIFSILLVPLTIFGVLFIGWLISKGIIKFNEIKFKCTSCNNSYNINKTRKYNGKRYCISCYKRKFNVCGICNKVVNETLNKFRRKKLCNKCLKSNKIKCLDCKKIIGKWEAHGELIRNRCESCYNLRYRNFRVIFLAQNKLNSTTFKNNPSKRFCGVEIECRNRQRDKNCFIRKELKNLKFSQVIDSSINSGGVEFVSKPLNGDLLFNSIGNFCKILHKKKYFVDRSCGLHIHLGVQKRLKHLKKLYLFYEKFEPLIFKMVPISRQATNYCMKFDKVYHHKGEKIIGIKSLHEFKTMIYETKNKINLKYKTNNKYTNKRYCWTNFHSVFYRGTLEIRNHSGTTSEEKIKNWLELHLTILDYLEKVDLQTINELNINKKTFLSLFNKPLQKYIKDRWEKFETNRYAKEEN